MKVLILGMVFAGFVGAGFYVRNYYKVRKVFFENLLNFCDHLLIEISFQKSTIQKIIQTYGDSYGRHFRNLIVGYQNLIETKQDITREKIIALLGKNRLKPAEITNIADFLYELGRHGSNEENSKIQSKRVNFDNFFEHSANALKRDASIYLKVFILMGIAAVILLV